jgi:sensor histidine kinase YesM
VWSIARQSNEAIQLRRVLVWQSAFYLAWIPATVLVWALVERWDPARLHWQRWLAGHAAALVAVSLLQSVVVVAVGFLLGPSATEGFGQALIGQLRGRSYFQVIIYAGVAAAGYSMMLYRQRRERDADAARLSAQLASARLEALRGQLHPHFLFNSLHAISSLVRDRRNDDAVRLISGMSDLLRSVLETDTRDVPLRDEIDLVRRYVEIQQVRFSDRLYVSIDLDPATLDLRVPTLSIQPLVENAVRHGMTPRVARTHIRVRSALADARLRLDVEDDGAGLPPNWAIDTATGTGLRNLRDRLHAVYGPAAIVAVGPSASGGTLATLHLPALP